ncbi:DNA polymerase III PolC-type-like isoform X1 [Mercenaria mercenaria]|uniref:DNA polymerase III PolC-type-like isoform X1 n=2 Tax=Mercenaria mercenaria TaxID=6596 RepID=UPI001E1D94AF|nr:DNA polymerase III PolC-type-like isoform X1 [Mercenaria mercenaria]
MTYQSEVGHEDCTDIDRIPDPIPRGVFKPVCSSGEPSYITVDLETTDLIRGEVYPHITQIAAKHVSTEKSFSCYVLPKLPMSASAEQVTKIVVTNSSDMFVNGVPVETKTIESALRELFSWLKQFRNVFLIAHNGKRFDFPIIINACLATGMFSELCACVIGLVDTLPVFKSVCPKRESYKQEDLARTLLSKVYNAHNALDDVKCLSELVSYAVKHDEKCVVVKSFPPRDVKHSMESNIEKKKNMPSLSVLVANGVMKSSTADNVASSGLNFKHLHTIFLRKGEDGLYNVFTMRNSEGLPRVTNSKRVLEAVIPKLVSYFEGKN